jgi:hypothetical protein
MSNTAEERIAFHADQVAAKAAILLEPFDHPEPDGQPRERPIVLQSQGFLMLVRLLYRDATALKSAVAPRRSRPRLEIVR